MKIKQVVLVSMGITASFFVILLFIGLFIPTSLLQKIAHQEPPNVKQSPLLEKNSKDTVTDDNSSSDDSDTTDETSTEDTTTPTTTPSQTVAVTPVATTTTPKASQARPSISLTISPASITQGSAATLSWSVANSPSSCSASGGWAGAKGASGSEAVQPAGSTSFTLSCANGGGSDTKAVSLTVVIPPKCGQPGGVCHKADITPHNTSGDCRSAINASGSGMAAYLIPSSFITLHQSQKSIASKLCGVIYTKNLAGTTSKHRNGDKLGGSDYAAWMNNFYIGPYN